MSRLSCSWKLSYRKHGRISGLAELCTQPMLAGPQRCEGSFPSCCLARSALPIMRLRKNRARTSDRRMSLLRTAMRHRRSRLAVSELAAYGVRKTIADVQPRERSQNAPSGDVRKVRLRAASQHYTRNDLIRKTRVSPTPVVKRWRSKVAGDTYQAWFTLYDALNAAAATV